MSKHPSVRASDRSRETARRIGTLVAVPIYNEASYVRRVLRAIRQYACDILVVDDGSADDTAGVTRRVMETEPHVRLVQHPVNRGFGAAVLTGFAHAQISDRVTKRYEYAR